jgi:hypothetical protein
MSFEQVKKKTVPLNPKPFFFLKKNTRKSRRLLRVLQTITTSTGQASRTRQMANQANKKAEQRVKDFRLWTPSFNLSLTPCFDDIAATLVLLLGV